MDDEFCLLVGFGSFKLTADLACNTGSSNQMPRKVLLLGLRAGFFLDGIRDCGVLSGE